MEMMESIAILILVVMVVIGVISAFVVLKRRKGHKSTETNYRVFYITGLILLPIGIIWIVVSLFLDYSFVVGIPFLGVAVTYITIGLAYKDKWRK